MGGIVSRYAVPAREEVVSGTGSNAEPSAMMLSVATDEVPKQASPDHGLITASVVSEEKVIAPIRLIPFPAFKQMTSFPRYPNNAELCTTYQQIDREHSLIVFISHCWLRGWEGAEGWDGTPHPDNQSNNKFELCCQGIECLWRHLAPGMSHCYLWTDFGCMNQDQNPAGELKQLDEIIRIADCIFTPIYHPEARFWNRPAAVRDWYVHYEAKSWNGEVYGYVNRCWCRVEMFYAANISTKKNTEERLKRLAAGLKTHAGNGIRPHFLYGTKEMLENMPPTLLPPLQNAYFDRFHPEKGSITFEKDRLIIERLVMELLPLMKHVTVGYEGQRNQAGQRHGLGKYVDENGDSFEGEWECDQRKKGVMKYSVGDVYEGDFSNDLRHGKGKLTYADGTSYEGDYAFDKKHGIGCFVYVDGSKYEGGYVKGLKEGRGVWIAEDGRREEGHWHLDHKQDSPSEPQEIIQ